VEWGCQSARARNWRAQQPVSRLGRALPGRGRGKERAEKLPTGCAARRAYAINMQLICINMHGICILYALLYIKYALNMQSYALNMLNFKVQKGGNQRKRCSIQRQNVIESGSLQACRCGGTNLKFTNRKLLLAYRLDAHKGICFRYDASDRINRDRYLRSEDVLVIMQPKAGCSSRHHNSDVPVDAFASPHERKMKEIRLAVHLLACQRFVQKSVDAVAINVSADVKQFDKYPTFVADVEVIIVEPDTEWPDAFGNCPAKYDTFKFRPPIPIMLVPCKAVTGDSLLRRLDGGHYNAQTALKLVVLLVACGVNLSMDRDSGTVRVATDAASDNRGHGSKKATMDHIIVSAV
jgi:hypothetical protein